MTTAIIILYMAIMSRLSGNGFGKQWGLSFLPEILFSIPLGAALGYVLTLHYSPWISIPAALLASVWSYAWMQSGTWPMLRWVSYDDPNTDRNSTLKPLADWISKLCGWKLGDEGYSWVYAALKGFLIGLPVGGLPLAILWPLGYEIGSHARGRVDKWIDPHAVSEVMAGAGSGVAIVLFLAVFS